KFDLDPDEASVSYTLVNSAGTDKTADNPNLIGLTVKEGVTRTDTYRVLYELALPGLSSVDRTEVDCPSNFQGTCLALSADNSLGEPGDVVVLRNASGTCKSTEDATKEVDFTVRAKDAPTGGKTILFVDKIGPATLPAECEGMTSLAVRASGAKP